MVDRACDVDRAGGLGGWVAVHALRGWYGSGWALSRVPRMPVVQSRALLCFRSGDVWVAVRLVVGCGCGPYGCAQVWVRTCVGLLGFGSLALLVCSGLGCTCMALHMFSFAPV